MKKFLPLFVLVIVAILAIWTLVQFSPQSGSEIDSDKVQVYSSIVPIADLVAKIGGDFVQSSALVPAGASVHTYEPTPSQLKAMDSADLFVKIGTPIEFEVVWLDKLLGVNSSIKEVDLSSGLSLMEFDEDEHHDEDHEDADEHEEADDEHDHEGVDPHIWLSVKNVQIMVATITDALSAELPEQQAYFESNRDQLLAELIILDEEIEQSLSSFSEREMIVYHDAWGYFARDYALNLMTIEDNQKEPTAKRIQEVILLAQEHDISVIFASPEFNSESAETIAQEVGAEVVLLSPLPDDLLIAFEQIAQAFANALR